MSGEHRICGICSFFYEDGDCIHSWEHRKAEYPACPYFNFSVMRSWAKCVNEVFDKFAQAMSPLVDQINEAFDGLGLS